MLAMSFSGGECFRVQRPIRGMRQENEQLQPPNYNVNYNVNYNPPNYKRSTRIERICADLQPICNRQSAQ